MKNIRRTSRFGLTGLVLAGVTFATAAWAANSAYPGYGQHLSSATPSGNTVVTRAEFYVSRVFPANNSYTYSNQTGGGQITITDPDGDGVYDVNARVVCGSFVARVHRLVHGLTGGGSSDPNDTMNRLFGSGLPNAAQWYDGIVAEGSVVQGTGASAKTVTIARVTHPMAPSLVVNRSLVLASKYTTDDGDTGHVMIAAGWTNDTPADTSNFPHGATRRWNVRIFDSTRTSHFDGVDLITDSREQGESGAGYDGVWGTGDDNDDNGIGEAHIHVFTDDAGAIVAWTWTLADNEIYTQADRPMVAGQMVVTPGAN